MGTSLAKPSRRAQARAVDGALMATVSHGGGRLPAGGAAYVATPTAEGPPW
ncbi:hypothetical protein RM530_13740 [Algiphilus sp. W345]|uniref:Uncharacterized protein n=1 Tax=Banduia mediterranea TaxID=3075609 RepID=A0ABU2WMW8_9GAMM|nr:hypothetical protein [Algiphilus sp. W345]MDT0498417.1 hypothetical protein [Algiphilus sp. W345]